MTLKTVQKRLNAIGFDAGPADGLYGRRTEAAIMSALNRIDIDGPRHIPDPLNSRVMPLSYMPMANMQRIINHWSAGAYRAGLVPRRYYHICIEGDPVKLVKGINSIKANEALKGGYAAHTRGINTGSIGVSMMCMASARESPFNAGRHPMKKDQWDMMVLVNADLCERYHIGVTPKTVLSHAEVQSALGVWQRAKWDFTRLPFDSSVREAKAIGDRLRSAVKKELLRGSTT